MKALSGHFRGWQRRVTHEAPEKPDGVRVAHIEASSQVEATQLLQQVDAAEEDDLRAHEPLLVDATVEVHNGQSQESIRGQNRSIIVTSFRVSAHAIAVESSGHEREELVFREDVPLKHTWSHGQVQLSAKAEVIVRNLTHGVIHELRIASMTAGGRLSDNVCIRILAVLPEPRPGPRSKLPSSGFSDSAAEGGQHCEAATAELRQTAASPIPLGDDLSAGIDVPPEHEDEMRAFLSLPLEEIHREVKEPLATTKFEPLPSDDDLTSCGGVPAPVVLEPDKNLAESTAATPEVQQSEAEEPRQKRPAPEFATHMWDANEGVDHRALASAGGHRQAQEGAEASDSNSEVASGSEALVDQAAPRLQEQASITEEFHDIEDEEMSEAQDLNAASPHQAAEEQEDGASFRESAEEEEEAPPPPSEQECTAGVQDDRPSAEKSRLEESEGGEALSTSEDAKLLNESADQVTVEDVATAKHPVPAVSNTLVPPQGLGSPLEVSPRSPTLPPMPGRDASAMSFSTFNRPVRKGYVDLLGFHVRAAQVPQDWKIESIEKVVLEVQQVCGQVEPLTTQQALRLALASDLDMKVAMDKYTKICAWRKEYDMPRERELARTKLEGTSIDDPSQAPQSLAGLVQFAHQAEVYSKLLAVSPCVVVTDENEPISIWHFGTANASTASSVPMPHIAAWSRSFFEYIDLWLSTCSESTQTLLGHVHVFDLQGVGFSHVSSSSLKEKLVPAMGMGEYYVEIVNHIYVVNAGTVFTMAWKAIKRLVPERTAAKITVTKGVPEDLRQLLPAAVAPRLNQILERRGEVVVQRPHAVKRADPVLAPTVPGK